MSKSKAISKKANTIALAKKMNTKGDVKGSAVEMLKDLVVGVVGGGLVGAAMGKPSILVGIGTSLVGHYFNSSLATSFGLGIMASSGFVSSGVSGTSVGALDGAKERIKAFGSSLKEKFYLDKIIKPKAPVDESASGLGNVQYFKYPNNELDMGSLEQIERQIAESAARYEQRLSGYDDFSGIGDKLY